MGVGVGGYAISLRIVCDPTDKARTTVKQNHVVKGRLAGRAVHCFQRRKLTILCPRRMCRQHMPGTVLRRLCCKYPTAHYLLRDSSGSVE